MPRLLLCARTTSPLGSRCPPNSDKSTRFLFSRQLPNGFQFFSPAKAWKAGTFDVVVDVRSQGEYRGQGLGYSLLILKFFDWCFDRLCVSRRYLGYGHVAGAISVPGLAQNPQLALSESVFLLPLCAAYSDLTCLLFFLQLAPHTDSVVGVFCQTGQLAEFAANNLRKQGFSCVFNLGGTGYWAQAGCFAFLFTHSF